MNIRRSGSQPSAKGPAEYSTGTVRIDPLFDAPAPARVFGASVTFEPGARTAWHAHELGQALIVMAGCGRVQRWDGPGAGAAARQQQRSFLLVRLAETVGQWLWRLWPHQAASWAAQLA